MKGREQREGGAEEGLRSSTGSCYDLQSEQGRNEREGEGDFCREGGLLWLGHVLVVYWAFLFFKTVKYSFYPRGLKSLFHPLLKMGFYKDALKWESKPSRGDALEITKLCQFGSLTAILINFFLEASQRSTYKYWLPQCKEHTSKKVQSKWNEKKRKEKQRKWVKGKEIKEKS